MKTKLMIIFLILLIISVFVSSDSSLNWLTRHQADTLYAPITDDDDKNLHWNLEFAGCQGDFHINTSEYSSNSPHYRVDGATIYFAECEFP